MKQPATPPPEQRKVQRFTPEDRGKIAAQMRREVGRRFTGTVDARSRAAAIVKRVAIGAWDDGFIHAGNLAYMAMLAIFPFFIFGAAVFSAIGEAGERAATIRAVLLALPPVVANVIEPVAMNVIDARSGWLLWAGAAVGIWTVSSLIETIRELLRRAYGTEATQAFWKYRLFSAGIIFLSVVLLILSLIAQVLIGAAQEIIDAYIPGFSSTVAELSLSRIVPALGLFGALYMLFYTLTPHKYRSGAYPKWPGVLTVTIWWVGVTVALPPVMRNFFTYDLTYGSLAGMMIALFFFWLVGFGMVVGAELNAALAVTPEEKRLAREAKSMAEGGADNGVDIGAEADGPPMGQPNKENSQ